MQAPDENKMSEHSVSNILGKQIAVAVTHIFCLPLSVRDA